MMARMLEGKCTLITGAGAGIGRARAYGPQSDSGLVHRLLPGGDRLQRLRCRFEQKRINGGLVLNAIAAKVSAEEALSHIIPAGKFTSDRCKDLIESHNPGRVVESIEDDGLKRFLAPKLTGEGTSVQTISSIDQYYFMKLWTASNLPDPLDAQSARGLIGEAIDHVNILIAFRSRLMGLDARAAAAMMVPTNYGLGQAFNELPEANNPQNLARILEKTRYGSIFENSSLIEGARIEYELNRSHARTCVNAFAGSPFNVGLALAFLFLKSYELRDLFGLISAKANNVPAVTALESLILRHS